jgi:hypothetical protein
MATGGVDGQEGQRPGRAPPDSRPLAAGLGRAGVAESGEHRPGDDFPQPVQDAEHRALALPALLHGARWTGVILKHCQQFVRFVDCRVPRQVRKRYYPRPVTFCVHDEGVAAIWARVDDHHGSVQGGGSQIGSQRGVRDAGQEMLESFPCPDRGQHLLPFPGLAPAQVGRVPLAPEPAQVRIAASRLPGQGRAQLGQRAAEDGGGAVEAPGS